MRNWNKNSNTLDSSRRIYERMLLWSEILLGEWSWKGYCGTGIGEENERKSI
jgi:hypothetical protein